MDVSIIIVNYNTRELLRQCIESIYETIDKGLLSYEIIVTDNNSSDGSAEMLEYNFPGVILIKSKINGGFAYANNLGIKSSSGKYIFLLNSDTIVLKDVIYKMYQYMEQNKWVGILGPELLNGDLTHQTSISAFPTLFREFAHIYEMKNILKIPFVKDFLVKFGGKLGSKDIDQYMKNFQNLQQPEKVQVLVGAAMLIRREVVEEVGYLDENYFMYYEEIDYCYQCYKAGWSCVYNPIGQIIHLIGQSSKKISEKSFYIRYKSMMYYFNKNHGKVKVALVRINLILGLTFRIIFTMLKSLVKRTEGRFQAIRIYYNTILIACGSKKYDGARS